MSANDSFDSKLEALRHEYEKLLPLKIHQIEEAWGRVKQSDSDSLKPFYQLIHSLSGSGATFGFSQLSSKAKDLEIYLSVVEDAETGLNPDHVRRIDTLLDHLKKAIYQRDSKPEAPYVVAPEIKNRKVQRQPSLFFFGRDPVFAQRLKVQLSYYDFEVCLFQDIEAMQTAFLKAETPDVLIWDIAPPDGSVEPIEPISKFLKGPAHEVPSLFLCPSEDHVVEWLAAIRAGGEACFSKPVNLTLLIEKLHDLVADEEVVPYRLLIIDDDQMLSNHIATIMGKAGMEVQVVNEPLTVFQVMHGFFPDLILTDLHMPQCTGMELAKLIRQHPEYLSIPIVYLSSETEVKKRLEALQVGADDFLLKPIQYRYLYFSLSSRIQRARALRSLVTRDSLTGLLNHTAIWRKLGEEVDRGAEEDQTVAFAIVDIDSFHELNQAYGHRSGDRVLKSLAMLLKRRLRRFGSIGRYSGEQFAVILPHFDEAGAFSLLDRLREDFSEIVHDLDQGGFHVTMSCGISSFPQVGTARGVAQAAARCLLYGKELGVNRVMTTEKTGSWGSPATLASPLASTSSDKVVSWPRDEASEAAQMMIVEGQGDFDFDMSESAQAPLDAPTNFVTGQPFTLSDDDCTITFEDEVEAAVETVVRVQPAATTEPPVQEKAEGPVAPKAELPLPSLPEPKAAVEKVAEQELEPPQNAELIGGGEDQGSRFKVLVVDDEKNIRDMLTAFFEELGCRVVTASDGDQGFETAKQQLPDLLISDLLLFPGIHGFELCRRVKRYAPLNQTKIIVMTAVYKSYRYRMEAREMGADAFFEKPLNLELLKNRVLEFMGQPLIEKN